MSAVSTTLRVRLERGTVAVDLSPFMMHMDASPKYAPMWHIWLNLESPDLQRLTTAIHWLQEICPPGDEDTQFIVDWDAETAYRWAVWHLYCTEPEGCMKGGESLTYRSRVDVRARFIGPEQ